MPAIDHDPTVTADASADATGPVIGVALALAPGGVEVDPLTGQVTVEPRLAGLSEPDRAALEWSLRIAERWGGTVMAVTIGPASAEVVLREALSCGAAHAVRVAVGAGAGAGAGATAEDRASADAQALGGALASVFGAAGAELVLCGDAGTVEGSGAVPAFLAHHLGAAQALGLVDVSIGGARGRVEVTRRLDGGRRERLAVRMPAVLSVEGSTARLRRAPLASILATRTVPIDVVAGPRPNAERASVRPYRPRARVFPPPVGATALERVRSLTDVGTPRTPPRTVTVEPSQAAEIVLTQLREWGELDV